MLKLQTDVWFFTFTLYKEAEKFQWSLQNKAVLDSFSQGYPKVLNAKFEDNLIWQLYRCKKQVQKSNLNSFLSHLGF